MLLDNQFILAPHLPHMYKCHKGAGIGLILSAVVANLAFYAKVERHFLDRLQEFGIDIYIRFFDDIWILARSMDHLRTFIDFMKARSSYFTIKVTEISSSCVDYLDLIVEVENGTLGSQPSL